MLTTYSDDIIARLATGLEAHDRAAFCAAAEAALIAMPAAMLGPGAVYRAVESIWQQYYRPPDTSHLPQTELHQRPGGARGRRMRSIAFEGEVFRSRDEFARRLAPRLGKNAPAVAMMLAKFDDDVEQVVAHYRELDAQKNARPIYPARPCATIL